ncbi:MFS transporter [Salinivibrio costicola]|uniref:Antiporter n=2 Tax=Salinivibrio costicola TaxID=51367 RepID=A0ABX3KQQ7_SALCS|nr:MFS transporter [Salinivibrio costicola]OOF33844.1 antiporter [Salinivibrio costicola subsp. alcaliphilus]
MGNIYRWEPEDNEFWEQSGKRIAYRNLWISIPSLLSGFAVWLYWGILTVQMINAGYDFKPEELFTLTAIAGLSGATLRIPSSFFIRFCGGRNTIFFTTTLLIIPAFFTGAALKDPTTPLWQYQLLALLSGIGGGNFASSMSNISFFFPKKKQGLALGLNAGLGNFGVTTMQILIPWIMTFAAFGSLSGDPTTLLTDSGTIIGKINAGTTTWVQNGGYVWLTLLLPLAVFSWFGMNNIATKEVTPTLPSFTKAAVMISIMIIIGLFTSAIGLWLILPESANGSGWQVPKDVALILVLLSTLFLLKSLPGAISKSLTHQYRIFKNKHTWIMSVIYTMTFGSFIGFSAAFPLAIQLIFGYKHIIVDGVMTHSTPNPAGPSALTYAWMAPFIGALVRPVGGWLGDKFGGSKVTQVCAAVMALSALGAAYYMAQAYESETPQEYFLPFFVLFLFLFTASGVANGSVFRSIAIIFPKSEAGPVLGWTSAVAAYGAFYIPMVFGEQIEMSTPDHALIGFAIFYIVCMLVNWFFYFRKDVEYYNP